VVPVVGESRAKEFGAGALIYSRSIKAKYDVRPRVRSGSTVFAAVGQREILCPLDGVGSTPSVGDIGAHRGNTGAALLDADDT